MRADPEVTEGWSVGGKSCRSEVQIPLIHLSKRNKVQALECTPRKEVPSEGHFFGELTEAHIMSI